jgi:hypothetical protein
MREKREEGIKQATQLTFVRDCLVCKQGAAFEYPQGYSNSVDDLSLTVCPDCQEHYLTVGVALINPRTGSVLVIADEAFTAIFSEPIPESKVACVEEEVLQRVHAVFRPPRSLRDESSQIDHPFLN